MRLDTSERSSAHALVNGNILPGGHSLSGIQEKPITDPLQYFISHINEAFLSKRQILVLQKVLTRSYPPTRSEWRSSNCHSCSYRILNFFRQNTDLILPNMNLVLVTTLKNHSWLELCLDDPTDISFIRRADIVVDSVGLWNGEDQPYYGIKKLAPTELREKYSGGDEFRLESLCGRVVKTSDGYYWPWDDCHLLQKLKAQNQ